MCKKIFLFFLLICFCINVSFIYASGSTEGSEKPKWVNNVDLVYTADKYIAKQGIGETAESAKNNAANELATFLKANVSSQLKSELLDVQAKSNDSKSSASFESFSEQITISVDVDLFALEYTDPYFNNKDKCYYVVAFISREKAFEYCVAELDVAKMNFYNFYDKVKEQDDSFTRLMNLFSARKSTEEFVQKYVYCSLFAPEKVKANYFNDLNTVLQIESEIKAEQMKMPLYVKVNIDSSNTIFQSVSNVLISKGFTVINSQLNDGYTVDVSVNLNESIEKVGDDDVFVTYPDATISIMNNTKTLYSMNVSTQKNVSFTEKKSKSKSCSMLATKILEDFSNSFLN